MALAMSEYELDRLERIKENKKMLEELFPEGTDIMSKKRRHQVDGNSLGTGSGSEASYNSEEEGSKAKRVYQRR